MQSGMQEYTISDYLQGISELITPDGLQMVLAKRGLDGSLPYSEISQRDRDLAEAEVYYWLSNLPVGGATQKDVDGNYSHSEGGWTVSGANIAEWYRKYTSLRKKWSEEVIGKKSITLQSHGIRTWRRR